MKTIAIAGLALLAGSAFASPPARNADRAREPIEIPKKKRAGEACKTSDECQRHHTCEQTGEKSVCTAPPPAEIPKT